MIAFLSGLLIALAAAVAWLRRKAPEPPAVHEAEVRRDEGVKAIEVKAVERETLSDVDRAQAILDSSRGRKGPL